MTDITPRSEVKMGVYLRDDGKFILYCLIQDPDGRCYYALEQAYDTEDEALAVKLKIISFVQDAMSIKWE